MGVFDNLRQAVANARSGVASEEALASLTPEQRARYDAAMAEVERGRVEAKASYEQAREIADGARILDGPAGRYLYGRQLGDGPDPDELERIATEEGAWAAVRANRAANQGELRAALRQSVGRDEVPQERDPVRRAAIASEERAARDAARGPYRAADAAPVAVSRVATRGRTQLAELRDHLVALGLSGRPDLVFGVHRVPDRISGPVTPHSEEGRVVEWDVVHWNAPPGTDLGPPGSVAVSTFAAHERWVDRRAGEASVLDEDVALAHCLRAGIGPERCFGLARTSEVRWLRGGPEGEVPRTLVRGVAVVHGGDVAAAAEAEERMWAEAPLRLDEVDPDRSGVRTDVLGWSSVAACVHPRIHHPPACPSPFPYLPSTPEELLRAYLEVVGIQPSDCYGAQVTFDHAREIRQGGFLTTNLGPKQPCADGVDRMRTRAGEVVVVTYRDRPALAEGRERWAAYQHDVLRSHLEREPRVRPPIVVGDDADLPAPIRAAVAVSDALDWLYRLGAETVPPYRYCWPPAP